MILSENMILTATVDECLAECPALRTLIADWCCANEAEWPSNEDLAQVLTGKHLAGLDLRACAVRP